MEYHAHIYWKNAEERNHAMMIREWLSRQNCMIGRVHDTLVGPHTLPMYQAIYNSDNKELIENFLVANKGTNSILLHESINDDLRDHTDGARWLNDKLLLNLEIFEV